jgi:hypothetical protein
MYAIIYTIQAKEIKFHEMKRQKDGEREKNRRACSEAVELEEIF